ncbi:MAG: MmcQ/YjbR family DNA-binding protein [Pseudomonadota bacterium]|jgi:predicted DNA-binding protein (MmcQ/YjbR family)
MITCEEVEALAMALPAAHKVRLWDRLDVYKVTSKVFASCDEADGLVFKASEILYALLADDGPGRPAPGFVPGAWVAVPLSEVEPAEAADWIARSHGYAVAGLTRAVRRELGLA